MDEKLKIKISIADRVYPLTINMSQEEAMRSASKKIDIMIKQFEENYAVRDKQDVLAMCALQFASQLEQKSVENSIDGTESIERLTTNKKTSKNVLINKLKILPTLVHFW
jgi:cell division protein ZapA